MKTLKDVKVGETATVAKLHGEGPVKRRIMDMGITKGVETQPHPVHNFRFRSIPHQKKPSAACPHRPVPPIARRVPLFFFD